MFNLNSCYKVKKYCLISICILLHVSCEFKFNANNNLGLIAYTYIFIVSLIHELVLFIHKDLFTNIFLHSSTT